MSSGSLSIRVVAQKHTCSFPRGNSRKMGLLGVPLLDGLVPPRPGHPTTCCQKVRRMERAQVSGVRRSPPTHCESVRPDLDTVPGFPLRYCTLAASASILAAQRTRSSSHGARTKSISAENLGINSPPIAARTTSQSHAPNPRGMNPYGVRVVVFPGADKVLQSHCIILYHRRAM